MKKYRIIELKENERLVDLNSKTLDEIALILREVYPEVFKSCSLDFIRIGARCFSTKNLVLIEIKGDK